MPDKRYVLPEEREQMQQEALSNAISSVEGPVGFYEHWPGETPRLTVPNELIDARPFCRMIWENEDWKIKCHLDHKEKAASCVGACVDMCWLGVQNMICPVNDEYGRSVTLLGGAFRLVENRLEAQKRLEQNLKTISVSQQETLRAAWQQLPEVTKVEVLDYKIRELQLAGRSYLEALKQRSDMRYSADLATHDVVIALQALLAEIEVLKIELKDTFGIGRKWEERFETLIEMLEEHSNYLERRLRLAKPVHVYHSINKLIHECVNATRPQAEARGIDFRVDLEQIVDKEGNHEVLAVRMDRAAIRQALLNVLDNAVKYSFSGTARHPRWVGVLGQLETRRSIPGYSITLSNLGIGIEENELELVFMPGYQGRRRLDEDRSGYGKGLAFVKECVEEHEGAISIESWPQRRTGWLTRLNIWLPLQGPVLVQGE